jgi:hypothetical protein
VSLRRLGLVLAAAALLLAACGTGGSSSQAGPSESEFSAPPGADLMTVGTEYLKQTAAKKAAANGWKDFRTVPVTQIADPSTGKGIVALYRYSAVTNGGIVRGFLTVQGSNELGWGSLDLGSVVTPASGTPAEAPYDLSPTWRDNLQKAALDFVQKQQLQPDQTSFVLALGAGDQDNPLADAMFAIQGQTSAGRREYLVSVIVHDQQPVVQASTSVPLGPQKS